MQTESREAAAAQWRTSLLSPLRGSASLGADLRADARSYMLTPHSRLKRRGFKD